MGQSTIEETAIDIQNYPFKPSQAYPSRRFHFSEIEAAYLTTWPPTIKIQEDLIFISARQKALLQTFAGQNGIQVATRASNWNNILEPFLDTEIPDNALQSNDRILYDNRIDTDELAALRQEVGSQMYKYNFDTLLWEWVSLGLFDVLSAMRVKYNDAEFARFYRRALEIEIRQG